MSIFAQKEGRPSKPASSVASRPAPAKPAATWQPRRSRRPGTRCKTCGLFAPDFASEHYQATANAIDRMRVSQGEVPLTKVRRRTLPRRRR
jgi:hypothetical protein